MEMTAVTQYILTAAQSFGSRDYFNKFLMTIGGLAGVLFCENEQTDTKWMIIFSEQNTSVLWKAGGGLKATAGSFPTTLMAGFTAWLVLTCPKNQEFLQFSDVWDSYDQWEHCIPDIPDGRRSLRRDQKNRKDFCFESPSQTVPDVGNVNDECEHEVCLSGDIGDALVCLFSLPKLDFQ